MNVVLMLHAVFHLFKRLDSELSHMPKKQSTILIFFIYKYTLYLTCKLIAHYFFIVLFISLPISTDLHQFLLNYHRVCLNVWPFNFNNSRFISIFSYRLNTDQPNYLAILTIHSFGYGCILIFALAVFFPAVYDPEQNHI